VRRAARFSLCLRPLESSTGSVFVRPGCVCVKSSGRGARFGLCCGGTGKLSAGRGGGEPSQRLSTRRSRHQRGRRGTSPRCPARFQACPCSPMSTRRRSSRSCRASSRAGCATNEARRAGVLYRERAWARRLQRLLGRRELGRRHRGLAVFVIAVARGARALFHGHAPRAGG
jgi:hypothetical protein